MTPDEMRQLATEIVLWHSRGIEFLSVTEILWDRGIQDDDVAEQIHDLTRKAKVTVDFPEEAS